MANHLSDINVKLQHVELKYDKKLKEIETKCARMMAGKLAECEKKYERKMEQMETKYQGKFTEYENKLQEYENRLQTMGGGDNKKRKRSSLAPDQYMVEGCGIGEINGVYMRDGAFNNVPKYIRIAQYRGRQEVFTLYRFSFTRWFISIVRGSRPGTSGSSDVDFYACSCSDPYPPRGGWRIHLNGESPMPTVHPNS